MSKNNFINLFFLIIAITLASIIYFSENEENKYKLERLSSIDISTIKTITINHNKNSTTIHKLADNHWAINQPVEVDANVFRINSILKLINTPVHTRYAEQAIDTKAIGLDTPVTTISFNNHLIAFGITNPVTNLRYIKFDNVIYTIEDVYYPLISSNFSTLVSLNLLPVDSKINKLILINQTIAKNENGLWKSNLKIDADTVTEIIDNWQNLQAFGVHAYMKREKLGDVFIYTEHLQQPVHYLVTDTDPWLIIARPELELEYHLNIEAYKQLITPQ